MWLFPAVWISDSVRLWRRWKARVDPGSAGSGHAWDFHGTSCKALSLSLFLQSTSKVTKRFNQVDVFVAFGRSTYQSLSFTFRSILHMSSHFYLGFTKVVYGMLYLQHSLVNEIGPPHK